MDLDEDQKIVYRTVIDKFTSEHEFNNQMIPADTGYGKS